MTNKLNEKIILVDIDDTIADLMSGWLHLYNIDHNDKLTPNDILSWDIAKYVKKECGQRIYDYLTEQYLYDYVLPIPGALESIRTLKNLGYDIIYVTSVVAGANGQKLRWLREHNFLTSSNRLEPNYIECHRKELIRGDLLIDDKPENCFKFVMDGGGKSILFNRPHNKNSYTTPNQMRANNWSEVLYDIGRLFNE